MAKFEWVRCPICDEDDMRKELDDEGNGIIHCTNTACGSNGGTNFAGIHRLRDHIVSDALGNLTLCVVDGAGRHIAQCPVNFQ